MRQWLGFEEYYRRFIKDFAKIVRPLSLLLRKDENWRWNDEQQKVFDTLKEILCNEPVLAAPVLSKPFLITTDASDYALGAVLSQGQLGKDRPCAYASRCLRGSEFRYPTYDKELLAIGFAKEQFSHYLYGKKFTMVTAHEPLKHFHAIKKPDLRFNRLKVALRGCKFAIIYRAGLRDTNADALLRNAVIHEGEVDPERSRAELYELAYK